MSLIRAANEFQNPRGQIIHYALTGCYPSIKATVAVAETLRETILTEFHTMTGGKHSFLLSGLNSDGSPDKVHRHAFYLPKPDMSGRIKELLVVSPADQFSEEELVALKSLKILRWNGPSTTTRIELIDIQDQSELRVASNWVSLTPYVPPRRFWGTSGKHHLTPEKQLYKEIATICAESDIDQIKLSNWGKVKVRIAPNSKTILPNTPIFRNAYRVEFRIRKPLCGPIVLGHSSHFGLGIFIPVEL
jgi:CRISPR-associated protein Csb2